MWRGGKEDERDCLICSATPGLTDASKLRIKFSWISISFVFLDVPRRLKKALLIAEGNSANYPRMVRSSIRFINLIPGRLTITYSSLEINAIGIYIITKFPAVSKDTLKGTLCSIDTANWPIFHGHSNDLWVWSNRRGGERFRKVLRLARGKLEFAKIRDPRGWRLSYSKFHFNPKSRGRPAKLISRHSRFYLVMPIKGSSCCS